MRKIIFTAVVMLLSATSIVAQTVNDIFNEFKEKPQVQYINIPKSMMGMAVGSMNDNEEKDILKKLDSISILTIENNTEMQQKFEKKVQTLSKKGYEQMVNSNEDGEKAQILVKTKGDNISEMLIISIESDECALVQICGDISPEDVKKLENIAQ